MFILALESSTSSAKALLYDTDARRIVSTQSCPYPPTICNNGITDTEAVFQLTMKMGHAVAAGKDIAAVALSCVWHSAAICDSHFNSIGKTYSWNYLAPAASCNQTRRDIELTNRLYQSTGCMPHSTYVRECLRYLRQNGMDFRGKLFPSQGSYTFYRMTGEFLETLNTFCGTGFINVKTCLPDDFAMHYAGVQKNQFGEICDYKQVRPLKAAAAAMLGIASGIPVVPAHADGALNQIANCASTVGRMTLSIGTSGAIRLSTSAPVLPAGHQLWSYFGVTNWLSGAAISGACNCIDWFCSKLMGGTLSFDLLDDAEYDPEHLAVFLPFLFGERNPGWQDQRLAGFMDLSPEHDAVRMYRSIQAGILMNLYQCYEILISEVDRPTEIYASGGILHSQRWTQMMADVFGIDIHLVNNLNASGMGAVVLGMYAAGAISDVCNYTGDIDGSEIVSPRPDWTQKYQQLYKRYLSYYSCNFVT